MAEPDNVIDLRPRATDDDAMVELLEPMRPHRHRAVRLLEVSGLARNPRFGARQAIPDLRTL